MLEVEVFRFGYPESKVLPRGDFAFLSEKTGRGEAVRGFPEGKKYPGRPYASPCAGKGNIRLFLCIPGK